MNVYNGIVNIYKEKGFTSFDVVAKLRGIMKQKKIGHTGTLDPDAVGVLVVCLGNATKLCELMTEKDKEYKVTMLLGTSTDTEDTSGTVLKTSTVEADEATVRTVIQSFEKEYDQVPPMYSAIKVHGKRLYELAREGVSIERQPRRVTIYSIVIEEVALPRVVMKVRCSKGTYIRSLCRDIGDALGCGGCMEQLVRSRVSGYKLEDSLTLEQVEQLRDAGTLEQVIQPIESMFPQTPKVQTTARADRYLYNGNKLNQSMLQQAVKAQRVLVYDSKQMLKGIYDYQEDTNEYVPFKMFLTNE